MDARRGLAIGVAAAFALLILLGWSNSPTSQAVLGGLQNPGFEDGILGGAPKDWTVVQPVADEAVVATTEGPAQFPTYADMGNVTVIPYKGDLMLREGSPKRLAESQVKGNNTVTQTFQANNPTLKFSFRVFSWEHRGYDILRFNLKDLTNPGAALVVAAPAVPSLLGGCSTPAGQANCQYSVDVGKRGQYLDSGWREVAFSGIVPGHQLTLTYTAGGTKDNGHATWVYFDNVNTPPVAKFDVFPSEPLEGDFIEFNGALSYDPDPGDQIVSWDWLIDGEPLTSQNPLFIFGDQGTYSASLTVTDLDGASTTVSTDSFALDGDFVPELVVGNAPPLLDALNVEALPGAEATVSARFLDPGWMDSHLQSLSLGGSPVDAALQEDNSPAVASGLVTGVATPAGSPGDILTGTLSVEDDEGASASDNFQVTLVADNPQRHEPNDDLAFAPQLASGGAYLDYIQSHGDVDIFEVVLPSGQTLPPGSELLVTARDLPADYDLAVLAELPAGPGTLAFARSDFGQMAFARSAFARSAFARSAFARSAFARSAFARSAFARSAFARSALTFSTFPLSEMAFTGLDGTEIGSTDISPEELGIGAVEGTNLRVVGFSANRGLEDETALARSDFAGTRFFVAVFGANGAHSHQPLSLQIETSVPVDLSALLGPEVCTGTALVTGGPGTTITLHDYDDLATPGDDPAQTIVVTQRERVSAIYGSPSWNALQADLETLAQHPAVRADVISLPATIYDPWDVDPCNVDAANSVAAQVRAIIQARLGPDVQYVVFAGGDNIVPHRRVPDETSISNERDYALDSFMAPGSPLFASIYGGFNLTDDYYVDAAPSPWQGRELYIPDLPTGRLVETPQEMSEGIDAFLLSNGELDPATGFVSGYDFFSDGSQLIADNLATKLTPDALINDTWTADDLRCRFLGQGTGCPQPPDVAAVNAHFTHYAALSANGFAAPDFSDIFTSGDVAAAGPQKRVVFSMGCHAGLNAPDEDSLPVDPGLGVEPALDFPQAFAQRLAIYVASLGYGLGDDQGIGGTEKLMAVFAEKLMQGDIAAGSALVDAKQTYLSSLSAMTVYDEKSSIQATMYGLPMYRVLTSAGGGPLLAPPTTEPAVTQVAANLSLSLQDGTATTTTNHALAEVTTADGSYFTADGDSQATAGRPIQPRVVSPVPPQAAGPVHGVLLKAGAYTDLPGSDPVIALPTNEWQVDTAEPQTCLPSFWPSELASVNSLDTGAGLLQTLVVIPGQFRCTSGAAPTVSGVQRLYSDLTFELLRSTSPDVDPPDIDSIDLHTLDASTVAVTVAASDDPSGVARIVALRYSGGLITATSLVLPGPYPLSGDFTLNVSNLGPDDTLVIVAIDGAGNPAYATGKGANLSAVAVDVGPDQLYSPGVPVTIKATVHGFTDLTPPVSFLWDFGDNTFLSGILAPADLATVDVTVDGNGGATFSVQHTYWSAAPDPVTASLKITDAGGGIGVDDVQFRRCSDPLDAIDANADLVSCHVTFNDTAGTMTIGLRVAGVISNDYQYRIKLSTGSVSAHLKYNAGKVTGPASLQVALVNGDELRFTFNLADIGASSGSSIQWFAETQAGVPATPETGIVDDMPDARSFTSVVP